MQNPKTSLKGSPGSEGDRRISPRSVTSSRVVRQVKTTRLEGINSTTSLRTPKTSSPKIVDRASPRSPVPEKKRVGRVAELETQVTKLEDALRTVKEQLIVSESWKKQAKLDAEESRKELLAITLRLEESENILARSSPIETHDIQVLQDDNDDESQKFNTPNTAESAALTAALLEIDQLKVKLNSISKSESKQVESAYAEIHILKENMAERLSEMKNQLEDSKSSESRAQALASETLQQLETAKKTMESLKTNSDEYNAILHELEHSKARVILLEEIIDKMKSTNEENELKQEFKSLETENEKLKMEIKKLNGVVEVTNQDFDSLKSKLTILETDLCEKSSENEILKTEIKKMKGVMEVSKQDFDSLESKLTSLESESCEKSNENEKLKLETKKSNDEAAKVTERLETVKSANCELEEELRKLKLQMGQWRKAAEAATAMLCDENSDNNGRSLADRTWSMGHFSPVKKVNMGGSPCSVDIDDDNDDGDDSDEFLKRKNVNVLKRIGVLWKKPQCK